LKTKQGKNKLGKSNNVENKAVLVKQQLTNPKRIILKYLDA
jgi:hypothetical protein